MVKMKEIYRQVLDSIPDYRVFMTVAEMDDSSRKLAAAYPAVVRLSEIGCSREGRALLCMKIGNGSRNALLFGLPHPNEPIGAMMLEHFTAQLAANERLRAEFDFTWYVVKAWDVDGAVRNEGWFKGPFTITNYMRNFFRPAGYEQVDWTFPIDYKELHFHDCLPETKAMMNLIDEIKPDFIYALHNSGFGGTYWYMTEPRPEVYDGLHAVPAKYGLPLHLGEPESPACEVYAQAIYSGLGIAEEYDHIERYAAEDMSDYVKMFKCGDCSAAYAGRRHGSFTLLTELPYFYDPRIEDRRPSDMTRRDAALRKLAENEEMNAEIQSLLNCIKPSLSPENPFLRAIEDFSTGDAEFSEINRRMVETDPQYEKTATIAEKFDNLLVSKFYKGILYGMLLRAGESALNEPQIVLTEKQREVLEDGVRRTKNAFERIMEFLESEMDYRVVPIRDLVGVQIECGLIVADLLQARRSENR